MISRICKQCSKRFETFACRVKVGRGLVCSRDCADAYRISTRAMKDESNPAWKGGLVSYNGIHRWLRRNFKKNGYCEWCAGVGSGIRKTDWACITGNYTRNRGDYAELCITCHRRFDWGHRTDKDGNKIPLKRVKEVQVTPL